MKNQIRVANNKFEIVNHKIASMQNKYNSLTVQVADAKLELNNIHNNVTNMSHHYHGAQTSIAPVVQPCSLPTPRVMTLARHPARRW